MFFPGSRYYNLTQYQVVKSDGTTVTVTQLPLPANPPLLGLHPRLNGQRLDLIASHFLNDATAFWQLCDANDWRISSLHKFVHTYTCNVNKKYQHKKRLLNTNQASCFQLVERHP